MPPSWSTRTLAAHLGLSQTTISRIWRAFALAPHRTEGFKLFTDPYFVDKVQNIVGLYLHPPERALVLCVDEKSSIQDHSDTAPAIPMQPGQLERHTHDYIRHGTTDLFAASDVKAGTVIAEVHRRHRSVEFRHFLQTVERATPACCLQASRACVLPITTERPIKVLEEKGSRSLLRRQRGLRKAVHELLRCCKFDGTSSSGRRRSRTLRVGS